MFPNRYFPTRHFPFRYFPGAGKIGEIPVTPYPYPDTYYFTNYIATQTGGEIDVDVEVTGNIKIFNIRNGAVTMPNIYSDSIDLTTEIDSEVS